MGTTHWLPRIKRTYVYTLKQRGKECLKKLSTKKIVYNTTNTTYLHPNKIFLKRILLSTSIQVHVCGKDIHVCSYMKVNVLIEKV